MKNVKKNTPKDGLSGYLETGPGLTVWWGNLWTQIWTWSSASLGMIPIARLQLVNWAITLMHWDDGVVTWNEEKSGSDFALTDWLHGNHHGTVNGGSGSENLAADEPHADSCLRRQDSHSDRLDNARGWVSIIVVDVLRPLNYSGHRTELATVASDELAGDSRFTALRHIPGHIHHIDVTHFGRLIIVGDGCNGRCHEFLAPVTSHSSDRRASSSDSMATALAYYKLRPPWAP
jgi:hypothetical protein